MYLVDTFDEALKKAKEVQEDIRKGRLLELVEREGLFEDDLSSDSEEERGKKKDPFKNFQSRAFQRVLEEHVEGKHKPEAVWEDRRKRSRSRSRGRDRSYSRERRYRTRKDSLGRDRPVRTRTRAGSSEERDRDGRKRGRSYSRSGDESSEEEERRGGRRRERRREKGGDFDSIERRRQERHRHRRLDRSWSRGRSPGEDFQHNNEEERGRAD
mmetsp:Transcript_19568/g.50151  ORF Transcript_19568/g.50151 Transcript_19568/m.50151 type:complete len:213 (-) Transcript_19568:237-875(-)